jgi:hypothetical protein
MLNTKNLNVIADSVDDIIVVDDQSLDSDPSIKFKVIGLRLGKARYIHEIFLLKN